MRAKADKITEIYELARDAAARVCDEDADYIVVVPADDWPFFSLVASHSGIEDDMQGRCFRYRYLKDRDLEIGALAANTLYMLSTTVMVDYSLDDVDRFLIGDGDDGNL